MKKPLLALPLLALAAAAQAGVNCKFDDVTIATDDTSTMFQYSASGQPGRTGKISFFRLMANDGGNPSSSIELKTVDVMKPGEFAMTKDAGWVSVIRLHGKTQRVTAGKFSFKRFDVAGSGGRAAGTLEFTTAKTEGRCDFDVEFSAVDRDLLPH